MSFYRKLALKFKSLSLIFLLLIIGCSATDVQEVTTEETVVKGSFALPAYNGQCIYSQEEAVNELESLRQEESLDFEINILYQAGPPECNGRVWGSNLAQGAKVDIDTSRID